MQNNTTLQELNNRVSVMQLAIAFGYMELRSKSYRNGTAMVLGSGGEYVDEILISPSHKHPGQQHFQNFHDDHDGGNSAAIFVYRCMEKGFIPDPLPGEPLWQNKVKAVICNYLNMPVEVLKAIEVPKTVMDVPFDSNTVSDMFAPLSKRPFLLMDRQISAETYNHPLFKDSFFMDARGREDRNLSDNLLFPLFRSDGSIGGVNIRYYNMHNYKHKSRILKGSEHASTVWHSNIPERIDNIFIAESEYDCMAHFQLKGNPNTLYVAHQGYLMPQQVDTIYNLIRSNRDKIGENFKLLLGSDNDVNGAKYDLRFIRTAAMQSADKKCAIEDRPSPSNPLYNDVVVSVRADLYEDYKNRVVEAIQKDNLPIPFQCVDDKCLLVMSHAKDDFFSDRAIAQLLLKDDLIVKNIVLDKPIKKDWNDDVKELNRINHHMEMYVHTEKRMDYRQFRDIYPKHFIECGFQDFIKNVVRKIASELPEPQKAEPFIDASVQQEDKGKKIGGTSL